MSEDLQGLLNKIRDEGLNKAQARADEILAEAEAKAKAIIADAESKASAIVDEAKRRTETFTESSRRTLSQAASNLILDIDGAILKHLEKILAGGIKASLLDVNFTTELVRDAVKTYLASGKVELAAASALADALRSAFAAEGEKGVQVMVDESCGAGFRVLLADGRIEHDFTAEAISQAISRQVRPALAELLK